MAAHLARLLVERAQALVEPGRPLGKVGVHEWMNNLVHQRAAAGLDVHDERLLRLRVVALRRARRLAGQRTAVAFVASGIAEQPDVEDFCWVARGEMWWLAFVR